MNNPLKDLLTAKDLAMIPVDLKAIRATEHREFDEKVGSIAEVPRDLIADLHRAIDTIFDAVETALAGLPTGATNVEMLQEQALDGFRMFMGWILGNRLKQLDEPTQKLVLAAMMGNILKAALMAQAKAQQEVSSEGGIEVPNYDKSLN